MSSHIREMTVIRINANVTDVPKKKRGKEKPRLKEGRLDEAKDRTDYKTDVALAGAVGVNSTQIGRWRDGSTVPEGRTYARLCGALGVLPGWLFGEDLSKDQARKEVADMLEHAVGKSEADVVRLLGVISDDQRKTVVDTIAAMAEAERRRRLTTEGWKPDVFGSLPNVPTEMPLEDADRKPDPEAIEKQRREQDPKNPKKPGK